MNSRKLALAQMLMMIVLSSCATHELVLSTTLRSVLSSEEINFSMTHFNARVDRGSLEVWGHVKRSDSDYKNNFDQDIDSTAALCAALANNDLTFKNDWYALELELTHEYGSQWRWRNTVGHTKVRIGRETLLELRRRNVPASEYPKFWQLVVASKIGPPDYIPLEWVPADVKMK